MCVRSVLNRCGPRHRTAGVLGFSLVLLLNLSLGAGLTRDSVAAGGVVPSAGVAAAAAGEGLREQVARDGWVQVRVDLRQSGETAAPLARARAAVAPDDPEQRAQDLLFALPEGSWRGVQRAAGSGSLTLEVDAAGLDELLVSPLVRTLSATGSTGTQRIAAGGDHSLAIQSDGTLWAWGYNGWGQLGDGTTTNQAGPVQVMTGVSAVSAGNGHSLAIKTDATLWAWGHNLYGQVGNNSTANRLSPVQVKTGVAAVASGGGHNLAIAASSDLYVWGKNWTGQLGVDLGMVFPYPYPYLYNGLAAAAAGGDHSLTLVTGGTLFAFGSNVYGQIGDGSTTDRLDAVSVMSGVTTVAAGQSHSLAIKSDGTLWAWGYNVDGQLGDGSTTNRLSPVQVLTGVSAVAGGGHHTLALKTDRSLWAWGSNVLGQIGDGTNTTRLSPVQVMTGVAAIAAGRNHSLVLKIDGSLWAWGGNDLGQLGDGTTTDRKSPVQVSGFGPPPRPDFAVTGVALTPAGPLANATFNAAVTVRNLGTAAGTPGTLQVWANQSAVQGCAAVGNKAATLTSLAAGASRTVTLTGLPAGAPGSKTLRAFIDSTCLTAEIGETNNQFTKTYSARSSPDFVVTGVVLTPPRPTAEGTFSVAVTVRNQGTAAGTPGTLQVWANQAGAQTCAAAGNASVVLTSLAVGASRTVTLNELPAGRAGAKTLRTFIDSRCQTTESNEVNNQSTTAFSVRPLAPDFVVTRVVPTPSGPVANGTFDAAVTVMNQGTVAGVPGTLQVWANQTAVPTCGAVGTKAVTLTSLAAGASRTVTVSGLPAGAVGAKTLRAYVDGRCEAAEADETNNQGTAAYSVFPTALPDFVVTGIAPTPGSPRANGTFSAAVTVQNQGAAGGSGGYLDVWANEPTTQVCGADGDAYVSVGTLAAGATKTLTVTGLRAGAAGSKTLRAVVDSGCQSGESYETNNQTAKTYAVVP